MEVLDVTYQAGSTIAVGKCYKPNAHNGDPLPIIIVAHDWSGLNEFAQDAAKFVTELGFIGFAIDLYGSGAVGKTIEEKSALMTPLVNNREELRNRMLGAFQAVADIPGADPKHIGCIGFCFGGMACLDLARSGVDLKMAISVHGLLNPPKDQPQYKILSKILELHGYDDPMVTPNDINNFIAEIDPLCNDWQINMYGHTLHGFTNPEAHDKNSGILFNHHVANNAWANIKQCIIENFAKK
jgi:dienelactone hydrolase